MKHLQHFLLLSGVLALSCLRPSEERIEQDRAVGSATSAGISVEVREGLAAVRALSAAEFVLWGSAPAYELTVRTDQASDLSVEIQNCLTDAELTASSASAVVEAEEATDPNVPTRKRYRLSLPAGETRLAVAAGDQNSTEPFRFALLSDVQEAIDRVADVYDKVNELEQVRFLLGAGDLTERGTRAELERFQRELLRLRVPYFTTLGNHELGTGPVLYYEYFGRGNFQFRFHRVAFTLLDDASASLDPTAFEWLEDWLATARNDVHVVAMHIPPIDPIGVRNGSWASRSEAAKLLGRLAEGRVDLTLYGHVHSYYSFDNAGIPAFISGGGGAIPERFDRIGRHVMLFTAEHGVGITSRQVVRVD
ncbi:MAG: metallophosphoesterase [Myxococcales bacterium]|nr:MAG: metallophosphoesterase [Myxococcales bacterium]